MTYIKQFFAVFVLAVLGFGAPHCLYAAEKSSALTTGAAGIASARDTLKNIESIGITDNTNPEIKRLYESLNSTVKEVEELDVTHISDLEENAQAMHDKEQSTENKLIGAVGIGATGIGLMNTLSANAEQKADQASEEDMKAYLATFTCDYGQGRNIKGGEMNVALPGGNELTALVTEYKALAASLKERKEALGMAPGIESEEIIDAAETGLYDNVALGRQSGAYASLSRALMDENSADAETIKKQQEDSAKKLKTGAITAAVGAGGSLIANMIVNKDAPKENSKQINRDYERKRDEITKRATDTERELNQAIEQNKQRVAEFNAKLTQHHEFVAKITDPDCKDNFADYVNAINSVQPIQNELDSVNDAALAYNLDEQRTLYDKCVDEAERKRKIEACNQDPKTYWDETNNVCKEKTQQQICEETEGKYWDADSSSCKDTPQTTPGAPTEPGADDDPQQCPAENPRFTSLNENSRVGDPCSSSTITSGVVFKFKAGTKRNGKNVGGTCSCSALSCKAGYTVSNGSCVRKSTGGGGGGGGNKIKDANGYCVAHSLSNKQTKAWNAAKIKPWNWEHCQLYCKDYAKTKNCKLKTGGDWAAISHPDKNTTICYCNDSVKVSEIRGKYADSAGYCLAHSVTYGTPQWAAATPAPSTKENCMAYCKSYASVRGCKVKHAVFRKQKGGEKAPTACWCNDDVMKASADAAAAEGAYKQVCGKDKGKVGANKEFCVKDIFIKTNVQRLQAVGLAQEYARIKHGVKDLKCSNGYRQSGNDDWIQCISADKTKYFEFGFDDIKESVDSKIQEDVKTAICKIHGKGYGRIADGTRNAPIYGCSNTTDAECKNIGTTAAKMGYRTSRWANGCQFGRDADTAKGNSVTLRLVQRIDPYKFYNTGQHQANVGLVDDIKDYVAMSLGSINSFSCNSNPLQYSKITNGQPVKGTTDDVLTCTINGSTKVDFVFDDLSEFSDDLARGAKQNASCVAVGGQFNGTSCASLGKKACDALRARNATQCPTCKKIYWDGKQCKMPSAAQATAMEEMQDYLIDAGLAAAGLVLVVATGGTAAVVLGVIEVAGTATRIAATEQMRDNARKFLDDSASCKNATCAEKMLRQQMQAMANYADYLTPATLEGLDYELARLANLIPATSSFYQKIVNGATTGANAKGFFDADSWETEHFLVAVGTAMELASIITAGAKIIARKGGAAFSRFKSAISSKAKSVAQTEKAMTATQAKRLNEIDTRIAKIEGTPNSADEVKKLRQEKNTILNKVGTKDAEEVATLKSAAFDQKAVDDAQKELDEARNALKKRQEWEAKNPGAAKNDLMASDSSGIRARKRVQDAEAKAREMGIDFEPTDTRLPDGVTAHKSNQGVVDAAESGNRAAAQAAPVRAVADDVADAATTARRSSDEAADAARVQRESDQQAAREANSAVHAARPMSKAEKLAKAKAEGRAGFHGSDADIADMENIRWSQGSQPAFDGVSIARDRYTAENYAINRLIKKQNPHLTNANFEYDQVSKVLTITSDTPLNLNNKTFYIYELAADENNWRGVRNGYAGVFDAYYNKGKEGTEWLAKQQENLDDLIRRGRVKINAPDPADAAREAQAMREAQERAAREAQLAQQRAAREAQERAAREAQERAAREAQERAAREAQERAAREAQERAAREAQERAAREAQERAAREAQNAEVLRNTPTESQLDALIERGMSNRAARQAPVELTEIPNPSRYNPNIDAGLRRELRSFAEEVGHQGTDRQVWGLVHQQIAKEKGWVSPGISFTKDQVKGDLARLPLGERKLIMPPLDLEHAETAIDIAKNADYAALPFGTSDHQITLFKEKDKWVLLDQFGSANYSEFKNGMMSELNRAKIQNKDIVFNKFPTYENQLDCAIFSSQVSINFLDNAGQFVVGDAPYKLFDIIAVANDTPAAANRLISIDTMAHKRILQQIARDIAGN